MSTVNVEVEKQNNENNTALIRRFTKRVQGSGILPRVKSTRFRDRSESDLKRKRQTLKKLRRQKERARLIKLGKITEYPTRYSRSR